MQVSLPGLLSALLLSPALAATSDVARIEREIELKVSNGQFMGAALAARDGKAFLNKAYGKANLDWQIPNSPTTKFMLASLTKQFTAACILLLEERGKLKVEDPIKKYLPDVPAAWDQITIFNLLTHTSGIPDYTNFAGAWDFVATPTTPEKELAHFRDQPLDFTPGSSYNYSPSGYVLLGYLIEKLTGVGYGQFVKDNIFNPLGMTDSGYDSNATIVERRAVGYSPGSNGPAVARHMESSVLYASGGLYSTTADLLRWETALFGGKLLSPASLEKMTTAYQHNYGFGVEVTTRPDGDKIISHSGGMAGFNTRLIYDQRYKLTVAVLANLNGSAAGEIASDILKLAHGEKVVLVSDRKSIRLSPAVLDRYTGHYQYSDGAVFAVRREADHLVTQFPGQDPDEWLAENQHDFFRRTADAQMTLEMNDAGRVTDLVFHENGSDDKAMRIDENVAQQLADALALKIKNHTPTPGAEATLRRHIAELTAGTPDYDQLGPFLVGAVRRQRLENRTRLTTLGPLQGIEFIRVDQTGADVYEVRFQHGVLEWQIHLASDGKIDGSYYVER
jgi:CubicO group peptidase (beta-lactamase class C family)